MYNILEKESIHTYLLQFLCSFISLRFHSSSPDTETDACCRQDNYFTKILFIPVINIVSFHRLCIEGVYHYVGIEMGIVWIFMSPDPVLHIGSGS